MNLLHTDIKNILQQAKTNAVRAVNFSMVVAYWEIGRRIVEEEQHGDERAKYGEALLKEISKKLTADFGKGFSVVNLDNFRKFYMVFSDKQKSYALRRKLEDENLNEKDDLITDDFQQFSIHEKLLPELSWTHYRLLM